MTVSVNGYAIIKNDIPIEILVGKEFQDSNGVWHLDTWATSYLDADLVSNNIYKLYSPDIPVNKIVDSTSLELVDGIPTRTYTFIDDVALIPNLQSQLTATIDKLRDDTIDGGFIYITHLVQSRASDRENIGNLGLLATIKIGSGTATHNDLRWFNAAQDFEFILADNSRISLDAYGMQALYQTGSTFKAVLSDVGRTLKDWVLNSSRSVTDLQTYNAPNAWNSALSALDPSVKAIIPNIS